MKIKKRKTFIQRLRRFFWTAVLGGFAVVLPMAIFIIVIRAMFTWITNILLPLREIFDVTENLANWVFTIIALAIVIAVFFFIGLFVRTEFGNKLFLNIEKNFLNSLPLYPTLRETVQQFFGNKKMPFSQVVLVDVFNTPTRMTGFVTEELKDGRYTVFVPTGPNPTNGFIFHVDKEQLEFLEVKSEDAMRTIIGVGTGSEILFEKGKDQSE